MRWSDINFFRDNFRITTWLLFGACLQSCLVLLLPRNIALLPAITILAVHMVASILRSRGLLPNPHADRVVYGRATARTPNDDGTFSKGIADKEICVFILAGCSNHPDGLFAPGYKELGRYFEAMWKDASRNREKWGFLGQTPPLVAGDDDCSNTMVWITYWKSVNHLTAWADGEVHRAGWDWFNAAKLKHIGLQHETYMVPKGQWESVQHNMRPFGFAATKHLIADPESEKGTRIISPIQYPKDKAQKAMKS